MALFLPQRWRRQPKIQLSLNRSNPLTQGISVAIYGDRFNAIYPSDRPSTVSPTRLGEQAVGSSATLDAAYRGAADSADFSLLFGLMFTARRADAGGGFGYYVSDSDNQHVGIAQTAAADTLYGYHRADGGGTTLNVDTGMVYPYYANWAVTGTMASATALLTYKNGISGVSIAKSGASGYAANTRTRISFGVAGETTVGGPWYYKFNRIVSQSEILAINAAPYALLQPQTARIYSFAPAAGAQNLTPNLYTDPDTFYAATVAAGAVALTPALFADADTFHAATVAAGAVNLAPALFVDGDTFYSATVDGGSLTLAPSLFVDADAFFAPTVSPGAVALTPIIYTDADTFHAATLAAGYSLAPAAYADADAFYAATVAIGGNLSPPLFTDVDTFYSAIVAGGSTAAGHLLAELSIQPSLSCSLSLHASLLGTLSIN